MRPTFGDPVSGGAAFFDAGRAWGGEELVGALTVIATRDLDRVTRWVGRAAAMGGGHLFNFSLVAAREQAWRSAEVLDLMRHAGDFGLAADNVRFDSRTGLVFVGTKSLPVLDAKTMTLKKDIMLPAFPVPKEFQVHADSNLNQWEYLKHITMEGAKLRYNDLTTEIQERIDFELFTVKTMGFAGYFLIVADFINHGRDRKSTRLNSSHT